jgi:phage portal protein BeeE
MGFWPWTWRRKRVQKSATRQLPFVQVKSASEIQGLESWSSDPAWTFSFGSGDDGEQQILSSVWVYACVRPLANAVAQVPLTAMVGDEPAPADHPLSILLSQPVPKWPQTRWLQSIVFNLSLTGKCYVEKWRAEAIGRSALYPDRGLPKEVWPYPGSEFTPSTTTNSRRKVVESYRPTSSPSADVSPADIIDMLYVRPGSLTEGLSPVEASEREVSVDRQGSEWQQVSLQNRGVPDGLFAYKGEFPLTPTQYDDLQDKIDDDWTGIQNSHKPMVLGNDVVWQETWCGRTSPKPQ